MQEREIGQDEEPDSALDQVCHIAIEWPQPSRRLHPAAGTTCLEPLCTRPSVHALVHMLQPFSGVDLASAGDYATVRGNALGKSGRRAPPAHTLVPYLLPSHAYACMRACIHSRTHAGTDSPLRTHHSTAPRALHYLFITSSIEPPLINLGAPHRQAPVQRAATTAPTDRPHSCEECTAHSPMGPSRVYRQRSRAASPQKAAKSASPRKASRRPLWQQRCALSATVPAMRRIRHTAQPRPQALMQPVVRTFKLDDRLAPTEVTSTALMAAADEPSVRYADRPAALALAAEPCWREPLPRVESSYAAVGMIGRSAQCRVSIDRRRVAQTTPKPVAHTTGVDGALRRSPAPSQFHKNVTFSFCVHAICTKLSTVGCHTRSMLRLKNIFIKPKRGVRRAGPRARAGHRCTPRTSRSPMVHLQRCAK